MKSYRFPAHSEPLCWPPLVELAPPLSLAPRACIGFRIKNSPSCFEHWSWLLLIVRHRPSRFYRWRRYLYHHGAIPNFDWNDLIDNLWRYRLTLWMRQQYESWLCSWKCREYHLLGYLARARPGSLVCKRRWEIACECDFAFCFGLFIWCRLRVQLAFGSCFALRHEPRESDHTGCSRTLFGSSPGWHAYS